MLDQAIAKQIHEIGLILIWIVCLMPVVFSAVLILVSVTRHQIKTRELPNRSYKNRSSIFYSAYIAQQKGK